VRGVIGLLVVGLAIAGLLVGLLWLGQRRLMYFPFGDVPPPSAVGLSRADAVSFATSDGVTLAGWFVPAAADAGRGRLPGVTILVFNGNAGHRGFRTPLAQAFAAYGASVLLFDYRGYGGNPGAPDEAGLHRDARAAAAWVRARAGVDAARLVYFGESLGAAVAVDLAADEPPAALVLRSPFTSMTDVAAFHYPFMPVRWLLEDRFDALSRAASVHVPSLVIAGDRDAIVPFAQSRRLHAALPAAVDLYVFEGADHNDAVLTAGPQMVEVVVTFLESVLPPPS